jgi:exosortase/archaeosortase family protein
MHPIPLAAIALFACWDSWRWTIHRLTQSPEEGLSLLFTFALLSALAIPCLRRNAPAYAIDPMLPAGLLALHAALGLANAPSIIQGALATTLVAYIFYRAAHVTAPPAAFWGLIALSMPVLPSLQFVFGYPLRVVSASLTVALRNLQGVPITRDGTYVTIAGQTAQFDAPCSGIAMLWALILVTLMAALITRLTLTRLTLALFITLTAAIAANALRVASLLYATAMMGETEPPWLHETVGLAAFTLAALFLATVLRNPWFIAPTRALP